MCKKNRIMDVLCFLLLNDCGQAVTDRNRTGGRSKTSVPVLIERYVTRTETWPQVCRNSLDITPALCYTRHGPKFECYSNSYGFVILSVETHLTAVRSHTFVLNYNTMKLSPRRRRLSSLVDRQIAPRTGCSRKKCKCDLIKSVRLAVTDSEFRSQSTSKDRVQRRALAPRPSSKPSHRRAFTLIRTSRVLMFRKLYKVHGARYRQKCIKQHFDT